MREKSQPSSPPSEKITSHFFSRKDLSQKRLRDRRRIMCAQSGWLHKFTCEQLKNVSPRSDKPVRTLSTQIVPEKKMHTSIALRRTPFYLVGHHELHHADSRLHLFPHQVHDELLRHYHITDGSPKHDLAHAGLLVAVLVAAGYGSKYEGKSRRRGLLLLLALIRGPCLLMHLKGLALLQKQNLLQEN